MNMNHKVPIQVAAFMVAMLKETLHSIDEIIDEIDENGVSIARSDAFVNRIQDAYCWSVVLMKHLELGAEMAVSSHLDTHKVAMDDVSKTLTHITEHMSAKMDKFSGMVIKKAAQLEAIGDDGKL